jgi:hypothetical protein
MARRKGVTSVVILRESDRRRNAPHTCARDPIRRPNCRPPRRYAKQAYFLFPLQHIGVTLTSNLLFVGLAALTSPHPLLLLGLRVCRRGWQNPAKVWV